MPTAPTPPRRRAVAPISPSPEQRRVLDTHACASIISALAGTGKTTTLCMKAHAWLAQPDTQAHILMLAYSRAGVTALRHRLLQLHGALPEQLSILTLEQLCEQVLREQGDPVEKLQDPVRRRFLILQAHQALRQELAHSPDNAAVHEWLAQPLDVDAFLAFEALAKKKLLDRQIDASGMDARAFCAEHGLPYALYRLFAQYERMRVGLNHEPRFYAEGDCTFELCRQIAALDWDQPLAALCGRYSAVLFDELHDLDEGALMVLRALVHGGNGPFLGAGDFNQHIHEGAFSVFGGGMQHILNSLPADTQVLTLHTTRRFGAEICAALNPLFDVQFAPLAGSSDAFAHLRYDSDAHCAQQLVELHAQIVNGWGRLHGGKGEHSSLNVILRNPQDSLLLEWVFGHEGVHYGCQGLKPFYLRREVALVLVLMWALHGSDTPRALTPGIVAAGLDGLLHYGRRAPRSDAVDADVLAQGQFDETPWRGLPGAGEGQKLAAALHASVARMRQYIVHGTLEPGAPARSDALAQSMALPPQELGNAGALCRHPLLRRIFADAPINAQERSACLASLDALAQLAHGIPVAELLGRITLLANRSIAMHQNQEPVSLRLLDVDACKGREFTFVAVPFVERGRFPGPAAHHEAYRERNMLYVATTRARTALWLLESAARPVLPGPL